MRLFIFKHLNLSNVYLDNRIIYYAGRIFLENNNVTYEINNGVFYEVGDAADLSKRWGELDNEFYIFDLPNDFINVKNKTTRETILKGLLSLHPEWLI